MVLPTIKNAYLLIEDNLIADFGSMDNLPKQKQIKLLMPQENDIPSGATVIPHCLRRQSRAGIVDRINGLSYEEIANRGGLNPKKLNEATEEEIYNQSKERLEEVMRLGTGAVEIGLWVNHRRRIKMLRVIKQLAQNYPIS
jgi:imidazolonepropionase